MIRVIRDSMASNYMGISFNNLRKNTKAGVKDRLAWIEDVVLE